VDRGSITKYKGREAVQPVGGQLALDRDHTSRPIVEVPCPGVTLKPRYGFALELERMEHRLELGLGPSGGPARQLKYGEQAETYAAAD
jgi:hypothetical protein